MVRLPFRSTLLMQHAEFIGNQSLNIIVLTAFFTGAVFGLQIGAIFVLFRAEGLMGGATGIALATELAPLMTGFLLAGRVGSSMTAELATMTVTEQILAMEAMGVREGIRATAEIQALGFHQKSSKEYMKRFKDEGVSKTLSDRDRPFGDYREKDSK